MNFRTVWGRTELKFQKKHFHPCPAEPRYIGYTAFANSADPDQLASKEAN